MRQRLGVEWPLPALASAASEEVQAAPSAAAPLVVMTAPSAPSRAPKDPPEQNTCSSGQTKRHMRTNILLINAALRILFLSETPPGSVHDQHMADTTPYPLPAGSPLRHDLGFPACTREGGDIIQPTKKPRGQALTPEQQEANREISRRRVRSAQVNSRVKRCRMLTETIRMWNAGMREMVMEIGCSLHHFRVRWTPSWTPMVYIVMNST